MLLKIFTTLKVSTYVEGGEYRAHVPDAEESIRYRWAWYGTDTGTSPAKYLGEDRILKEWGW